MPPSCGSVYLLRQAHAQRATGPASWTSTTLVSVREPLGSVCERKGQLGQSSPALPCLDRCALARPYSYYPVAQVSDLATRTNCEGIIIDPRADNSAQQRSPQARQGCEAVGCTLSLPRWAIASSLSCFDPLRHCSRPSRRQTSPRGLLPGAPCPVCPVPFALCCGSSALLGGAFDLAGSARSVLPLCWGLLGNPPVHPRAALCCVHNPEGAQSSAAASAALTVHCCTQHCGPLRILELAQGPEGAPQLPGSLFFAALMCPVFPCRH